jgi:hypothetical protein
LYIVLKIWILIKQRSTTKCSWFTFSWKCKKISNVWCGYSSSTSKMNVRFSILMKYFLGFRKCGYKYWCISKWFINLSR